jgi:hypothetical protein
MIKTGLFVNNHKSFNKYLFVSIYYLKGIISIGSRDERDVGLISGWAGLD